MPSGNPAEARDPLYDEAKRIFAEALEQVPEKRAEYLAQVCGANSGLRREVISLLENHDGASFLEQPPVVNAAPRSDPMIGKRVGMYRILRQIGMGGMGAVYLAERADEQFRKRVAVKAVRPGLINERALRRFQNERQTLAVLDHPNIIKLLDGGTTEDGVPYLVTEYVEGQPIDRYCASRRLPLRQRLELFRLVLAAVHCTHQNLVVHRDLKPTNILVTPDGVPKLLDFGIAKLLRPEYSANMGLTRTDLQPMTPEFASPEQIRGQPITTATDIYSLGVILYRLLAGRHPYELKTHTAIELEHAICESDPERPSKFAEQSEPSARKEAGLLRGDLDTIVLMAMRKEPQCRYASAEHFSEDIRRYLGGFPVMARKASPWYKASKFVGRHRATCAGALLLTAGLIASGAAALEEKRAAERRFEDLRHFANFVLNDFDSAMREGGTPARKKFVTTGLEYLDRLAREKSNASIRHDLVNGYLRIGDVQGNLYYASLGEAASAEESYRKALLVAEELLRSAPANVENQRDVLSAHMKLGEVLASSGNRLEALKHYNDALRINGTIQAASRSDLDSLKSMAALWTDIASKCSQLSDPDGALEAYRHALETVNKFPEQYSRKPSAVAYEREKVAYFSALTGDPTGAEDAIYESIAAFERVIAANPKPALRRHLAEAYHDLAEVQKLTGKLQEALVTLGLNLRITDSLLAEDPKNEPYQIDRQQALMMEIDLLASSGLAEKARIQTKLALHAMKLLADRPDAPYQHAADYAELLATTPFGELRDDAAALRYARKAVTMTHETDPEVLHVLALAYERNGDTRRTIESDRKALAVLPPVKPGRPPSEFRKMLEADLNRLSHTN